MIFFVLFLILLAWIAQQLSQNTLKNVQFSLRPEDIIIQPDREFLLFITIQNTARRFIPFVRITLNLPKDIQVHSAPGWHSSFDRESSTLSRSAHLLPGQRLEFSVPVSISCRGRYIINRLTLAGGDFLGLTEQLQPLERFVEVVIPPKETPVQQLPPATGSFLGNQSVNRFIHEDPVLTLGFREYTGREPMKRISWVQSAKGHGLMVKNFDFTTEPVITVLLNGHTRSYGQEEQLEQCFCMARTICAMLENRKISYDVVTNVSLAGGWEDPEHLMIRQGLGTAHFRRILEVLGRATSQSTGTGGQLLDRVLNARAEHGYILITTADGMPPAARLDRLQVLSGNNLLIVTPPINPEGTVSI